MSKDWNPKQLHLADIALHEKNEREGKNNVWLHTAKSAFIDNSHEANSFLADLSDKIDNILQTFDPYGYQDALKGTREDNIEKIVSDIRNLSVSHILTEITIIKEFCEDPENKTEDTDKLLKDVNDAISDINDYIDKHKLWNDEAREEFPRLSFLLNDFETGIYPYLSEDEKEFYTMVEKFTDLEADISTLTFAYHTDKVMTLVEDKNYLKGLSDENNLISDAVFRWYNGTMSENSDLNAQLFKNELEEIYGRREKDIDL